MERKIYNVNDEERDNVVVDVVLSVYKIIQSAKSGKRVEKKELIKLKESGKQKYIRHCICCRQAANSSNGIKETTHVTKPEKQPCQTSIRSTIKSGNVYTF